MKSLIIIIFSLFLIWGSNLLAEENTPDIEYNCTGSFIISTGFNSIQVIHENALFNCCGEIYWDLQQAENILDLTEYHQGDWCYCMCNYLTNVEVLNLTAGDYLVRIWDGEYAPEILLCLEEWVMVEGSNGGNGILGSTYSSGCLEPALPLDQEFPAKPMVPSIEK